MSLAAPNRFFPSNRCCFFTTSADFVSYLVLNFHRYTTVSAVGEASNVTVGPPAPPPQPQPQPLLLLLVTFAWCISKNQNRLPEFMTSPSQWQSVLCVLLLLPDGSCCRHYCCCAAIPLLGYRPPLHSRPPPPPLLLCVAAAGAALFLFCACS